MLTRLTWCDDVKYLYSRSRFNHNRFLPIFVINFFSVALFFAYSLGCLICFLFHTVFSFPIVIAASLPALIFSFIPTPKAFAHHPYAAFYAGCFTGMCSVTVIEQLWHLIPVCLLGTLLYQSSIRLFSGFGGRLGGIAFTSVSMFVLLKGLWV